MPDDMEINVGAPGVPVALNVTPGVPKQVTVSELEPATVPSVQLPSVAVPLASLVAFPPTIEPPPVATEKVTEALETGLLNASRIVTDGAICTDCPTVAV